jgi:hypothetical protein
MKFLLIILMFFVLTSCGVPTKKDVSEEIKNTGTAIVKKEWRKADDSAKNVEDYFSFLKSNYSKEEAEKFDEIHHQLELYISTLNVEKSKEYWSKLYKVWVEMNKSG